MPPQPLELFQDRRMRASANGYTSSAFTMTRDVYLELSKDAFSRLLGLLHRNAAEVVIAPSNSPRPSRLAWHFREKTVHTVFDQKSKRAVKPAPPKVVGLVY